MSSETAAKLLATVPAVDPAASAAAATLAQMGAVTNVHPDAANAGGNGGEKPSLAQRVAGLQKSSRRA